MLRTAAKGEVDDSKPIGLGNDEQDVVAILPTRNCPHWAAKKFMAGDQLSKEFSLERGAPIPTETVPGFKQPDARQIAQQLGTHATSDEADLRDVKASRDDRRIEVAQGHPEREQLRLLEHGWPCELVL
jgi:hypothetical protein